MGIRVFLYIIKSIKTGRHYVGITANSKVRLAKHNSGSVRSTKAYRPWVIIYTEAYASKAEARKRELFLKKNYRVRQDLLASLPSSNG